ncbi:MAG: hypothetical protein R3D28_12480 [Geminicoccaceae bacterium]
MLREILENADNRPCQRLEIERNGPDLRLVGRTASASDRASIMARLDTLEEAVDTAIDIDESNRFCNLYDILKRRTAIAWPRLARLYPRRTSHRLSYGEELMIQVQTPAEPSHLIVDYFTADGMVVHLRAAAGGSTRLAPFTEIVVGDPLDGSSLRIGPPSGNEVDSRARKHGAALFRSTPTNGEGRYLSGCARRGARSDGGKAHRLDSDDRDRVLGQLSRFRVLPDALMA